ncbi:MAG: hypothetical protein HY924_00770 [Elusimicrobia bacterium]|nr:hypothetical protein [Elusimicrobiota bacterium]
MSDNDSIFDAAKSLIVTKLKGDHEAHLHVGPLVLDFARTELAKPGATTKKVLSETCHGVLSGLLLLDKDVVVGAVETLKSLTQIIQERSGDPMRTMSYALEGVARIGSAVSSGTLSDINDKIEAEFMGAGEQFSQFAEQYHKKS